MKVFGNKEIYTVFEMLEEIEQRPGLYLGYASVSALQYFLGGFRAYQSKIDHLFVDKEYCDLLGYIEAKCHAGATESVSNALIRIAGDDAKAFELFIKLWHEFKEECPNIG